MRVRPRFFVDGCTQNSRLLRIFKSLGVTDFARVVIHHADSAGLPPSPPLFFGLCVICLIRAVIWELAEGRPPIFRRDSLVQKRRKPLRCQPMTVSGLTMSKRRATQARFEITRPRTGGPLY